MFLLFFTDVIFIDTFPSVIDRGRGQEETVALAHPYILSLPEPELPCRSCSKLYQGPKPSHKALSFSVVLGDSPRLLVGTAHPKTAETTSSVVVAASMSQNVDRQ